MTHSRSRKGLSFVLAICLAGVSLACTVLTLIILETSATAYMREQIGQKLAELAFQTTDKLDQGLYERFREVELLARRPYLRDMRVTAAEKEAQLNDAQSTYPQYSWMGITDMQGNVVAATKGMLRGVDVSKRPWWGDALRGIHLGDVHEAKLLAKKLPMVDGEPVRFIDVAFPIMSISGEPAGIIGVHMSWEWAREIERSVIEPAQARSRVDAMIISTDGTVLLGPKSYRNKPLVRPSVDAARAGNNAFVVETWDDGKDYLVGYSRSKPHRHSPGLGWTVLVRQDVQEAYAPVRQLQLEVLFSGIAISIAFSLFAIGAANRIARPLRALAHDAKRIQQGEADGLSVPPHAYREVEELSHAFIDLIDNLHRHQKALKDSNATLEQRVIERSAELAKSENNLRMIADSLPVMVAYVDKDQRYRFCNRRYFDNYGIPAEKMVGRQVADVLSPEMYAHCQPHIEQALGGKRTTFINPRITAGHIQYLQMNYMPDVEEGGNVTGFYVMTQDITDTKELHMSLEHDVLHDSLTGLPNRAACLNQAKAAIARFHRSGKPVAAMFLDIDKFKAINDTFGHAAGDKVLMEFAARLKECMRETDFVARLSGDEFVVLAEGLTGGQADAVLVAEKILAALGTSSDLEGIEQGISGSIGVAMYAGGNITPELLLQQADAAMYEAKRGGRGRIAFFTSNALAA